MAYGKKAPKRDKGLVIAPGFWPSRAPKNDADRVVIIRFRFNGTPKVQTGYGVVSREWARRLCEDPTTRGKDWFLGFDKASNW